MMTDNLPLILTLLKVGAGGADDGLAAAAGAEPLAPAAGEAAATGEPAGWAAAGDEAGAAAAAVGAAGAAVGLASVAGFAGAAGWELPQAARIGKAAAAIPSRRSLRRERRPGIMPAAEGRFISLTRHLLE